jgi:hypothetical protein
VVRLFVGKWEGDTLVVESLTKDGLAGCQGSVLAETGRSSNATGVPITGIGDRGTIDIPRLIRSLGRSPLSAHHAGYGPDRVYLSENDKAGPRGGKLASGLEDVTRRRIFLVRPYVRFIIYWPYYLDCVTGLDRIFLVSLSAPSWLLLVTLNCIYASFSVCHLSSPTEIFSSCGAHGQAKPLTIETE